MKAITKGLNDTSSSIIENSSWSNVGIYPTPNTLAQLFIEFAFKETSFGKRKVRVLDLFAGDGRLGSMFSKKLQDFKIDHNLFFLELREETISTKYLNANEVLINQNAFFFNMNEGFDIVLSNPPYLILDLNKAEQFGFTWDETKKCSRNLYGLGIRKGLELCKPGGYLAVIAPFGYVRGVNSAEFREILSEYCSEIRIRANSERHLFEGVNQDIAFQVFRKKTKKSKRKTKWKFAYNGESYKNISISLPLTKYTAEKYVRVGPIVWNRKKGYLKSQQKNNILLIYGGNITHQGTLDFQIKKYQERQYITPKETIPTDILTAPFIVIRRTIRGKPGSWEIDSALISDKTICCTAENHVIVVELPDFTFNILKKIYIDLVKKISLHYFHSGSPNISTKVVSKLFSELIINYI